MKYTWNSQKAKSNLKKHGIDFADAVFALEDDNALTIEDKDHYEQRFKTLGMDPFLRVLVVVYVESIEDELHIISARKADNSERQYYYEGLNYE